MCEICGHRYCPPECPMFIGFRVGGGRMVGSCGKCGRVIYATDKYIRKSEIMICNECIKELR